MKHILTILLIFVAVVDAENVFADRSFATPAEVIADVVAERTDNNLIVKMRIMPSAASLPSNREVWLRPLVTNGVDSLWLGSVIIAGRTRYYQRLRHDPKNPGYTMLRSGKGDDFDFSAIIPFESWMEVASLKIESASYGCCGDVKELPEVVSELASWSYRKKTYEPMLCYVTPPKEEVKTREIRGTAFVDFQVKSTVIMEDYRSNAKELDKIRATIANVKDDKDISITSISIKGFASPEGSYALNEKLAKGRTLSLADYVGKQFEFTPGVMHTSWEAEDWQGLADKVRGMDIDNKEAILSLISDSSIDPDKRERLLRKRYPAQYALLLKDVYPSLRHSDYIVNYVVRDYTSVEEIAAVMASSPQKLSLDELFQLARSYDSGSREFMEVMEVAVRMYPDSEIANINAALTAASHGDIDKARRCLDRAGSSPQAVFARGVTEACDGNYEKAVSLFRQTEAAGVTEATAEIEKIADLLKNPY